MSKTYKIRVANDVHKALIEYCVPLNAKRHPDVAVWRPETLAHYLMIRSVELLQDDSTVVERFLEPLVAGVRYLPTD